MKLNEVVYVVVIWQLSSQQIRPTSLTTIKKQLQLHATSTTCRK